MIKIDMEMPERCVDCPCFNGEYEVCQSNDEERLFPRDMEIKKPDWCPLIEVKE